MASLGHLPKQRSSAGQPCGYRFSLAPCHMMHEFAASAPVEVL